MTRRGVGVVGRVGYGVDSGRQNKYQHSPKQTAMTGTIDCLINLPILSLPLQDGFMGIRAALL